ncbi:MAG TPA: rRNA adenine N-6-methyltransferase family protein [Candidatus Limnocylindrales bacterium]|nr:rRNA adenine N-6-methyltransferase family protein [Candidatus Limnocylindrales bacterium]
MSFDRDAAGYYQGRPPYPQRVYDLLADNYGLAPGCQVLEVGPGSGTATDALLARGAHVTAVEPGGSLAELLRDRHRLCARYLRQPPKPLPVTVWRERLQAGGFVQSCVGRAHPLDPAADRRFRSSPVATFPNVAELSAPDRDQFLAGLGDAVDALGGLVDDPRLTVVYHTRRNGHPPTASVAG